MKLGSIGAAVVALALAQSLAGAQTAEQSRQIQQSNAKQLQRDAARIEVPIEPMIGAYEKYTVRRGDTLFEIARRHGVSMTALIRVNHLIWSRLRPGRRLVLPTLHILPRNPADGIVLNVPERAIYVMRNGAVEERYPVAVGKPDWQTALGEFTIRKKLVNPPWQPPKDMVEREGIPDEIVPPGPDNPLGDRWMGWSVRGFGFHSTNAPTSIGRVTSHGCVRLYPEAAHKLFDEVKVGTPIYSIYEPVLLGEKEGRFYLSVFPDIYRTGETRLTHVEKMLSAAGLLPVVDLSALASIVATADGYPHRIVGSDEAVTANGASISAAVSATRVRGQWIVPLRETAQALGLNVVAAAAGMTVIGHGHSLDLRTGSKDALFDGSSVTLSVPPTVVKGCTLVPLSPLTHLAGARIAYEKGKRIEITTSTAAAITTNGPATAGFHRKTDSRPRTSPRQ